MLSKSSKCWNASNAFLFNLISEGTPKLFESVFSKLNPINFIHFSLFNAYRYSAHAYIGCIVHGIVKFRLIEYVFSNPT